MVQNYLDKKWPKFPFGNEQMKHWGAEKLFNGLTDKETSVVLASCIWYRETIAQRDCVLRKWSWNTLKRDCSTVQCNAVRVFVCPIYWLVVRTILLNKHKQCWWNESICCIISWHWHVIVTDDRWHVTDDTGHCGNVTKHCTMG